MEKICRIIISLCMPNQEAHQATVISSAHATEIVRPASPTILPYQKPNSSQKKSYQSLPDEVKRYVGEFNGVNAPGAYDILPLQQAAQDGDYYKVHTLIAQGATLHATTKSNRRPALYLTLEYKAYKNHPHDAQNRLKIIQHLILCNAPVDQQVATEDTSIHPAISDAGKTALHAAVTTKNIKAVKFLLEAKAQLNIQNHLGKKPIDIAITGANNLEIIPKYRKKYHAIALQLLESGAQSTIPLKPLPNDHVMHQQWRQAHARNKSLYHKNF